MARAATQRYPAMAASFALHAGVLALAFLALASRPPMGGGNVVPVTLMTSADLPPAPAVAAPKPAPAATPTPVPQAPPQPEVQEAPPPPAPKPTPVQKHVETPTPTPKPAPALKHVEAPAPTPKVQPVKPAKATPELDLNALAASLNASSKATKHQPSSAHQGLAHPNQDLQARNTQGVGATLASGKANARAQAALGALAGEIGHLWNPNCGVPMGDLLIKVSFTIGPNGILERAPTSPQAGASDLATKVAAERAARAVSMRAPFADPDYAALYGQTVTVAFSQSEHCGSK